MELHHGDIPGEAEIRTLFLKKHWNKGYGTEMIAGLMEYALAAIQEGYKMDGQPLQSFVATCRFDNLASAKMATDAGMRFIKVAERYGAMRHYFAITLDEVRQKMGEKV